MNVPTNLQMFLVFIASPVVLGGFVMWVLKKWPSFQTFDPDFKRIFAVILSFVLGFVLTAFIRRLNPDVLNLLNPEFAAALAVVLSVLGNQGSFALLGKRKTDSVEFTQLF